MRVVINSAPPWADSGYGLQCRYLANVLDELGYRVAISAFGGVHEHTTWHDKQTGRSFQILSTGGKPYGNGVLAGNYKRFNADFMITLGDLWVMEPAQFEGLNVYTWVPVDCTPLGVMDKQWLDTVNKIANLKPVAMSKFGQTMLANAGYEAPVVPHATTFKPSIGAGVKWRMNRGLSNDIFLVSKVGVNNVDDRKAFSVTLQAFAQFAQGKDNVALYLHTEAQAKKAPNLAYMALDLGLAGKGGSKVAFADEYLRGADLYDSAYMESMFNATDVYDGTSKGEGFGVPIIEALACGTPVIGSDNSAIREKISTSHGWLVRGQREWAQHHNAWWQTPYVGALAQAYEQAYKKAKFMRTKSAVAGSMWSLEAMKEALAQAL